MDARTRVVSVRVADIRPQFQNLREWMAAPNNVYIGRGSIVFIDGTRFPPHGSIWANPFKVGEDGDLQEVLIKYRRHIEGLLATGRVKEADLLALRGKVLGCWCRTRHKEADVGQICHGDVLVEMINKL